MASRAYRAIDRIRHLVNATGFDVVRQDFRYRFVHALGQHEVQTVLDVGANTGQFARDLRRAGYTGSILSVEPLDAAFRVLEDATRADPKWSAERCAVSDRGGTLTINVSANSVSSSALPMRDEHTAAAPAARYIGVETVPARTVDELVSRHALDPERTLLKIDVQGFERSVLDGAAESITRFAGVRTEMSLVTLYDGQILMAEMLGYMDSRGLDLWLVERGFTDPVTRRILQVDGVFFRRG